MAGTNAAREAGERARGRMLDAAVELFAAKGFRGASVDDIAQRAGVTRSSLLYHFSNKEGILLAVLNRRDADVRIMQETGREGSGSETVDLLSTIRMRSPGIRAQIESMKLAHVLEAEAADPDHPARQWVSNRADVIRSHFAARYASDLDSRPDAATDAASLSAITLAVIQGLESQWLVDPESIDFDRALEVFEQMVLRLIEIEQRPQQQA